MIRFTTALPAGTRRKDDVAPDLASTVPLSLRNNAHVVVTEHRRVGSEPQLRGTGGITRERILNAAAWEIVGLCSSLCMNQDFVARGQQR